MISCLPVLAWRLWETPELCHLENIWRNSDKIPSTIGAISFPYEIKCNTSTAFAKFGATGVNSTAESWTKKNADTFTKLCLSWDRELRFDQTSRINLAKNHKLYPVILMQLIYNKELVFAVWTPKVISSENLQAGRKPRVRTVQHGSTLKKIVVCNKTLKNGSSDFRAVFCKQLELVWIDGTIVKSRQKIWKNGRNAMVSHHPATSRFTSYVKGSGQYSLQLYVEESGAEKESRSRKNRRYPVHQKVLYWSSAR